MVEISNRRARFDYFIEDEIECGIELVGTEIKSFRKGSASIVDSYGLIRNNEVLSGSTETGCYHGFYRVADGMADVTEFSVGSEFHALDVPLADKAFNLQKNVLVSGIIRDGKLIIPNGSSCLKAGDRLLLTAPVSKKIKALADAFR